MSEALWKCVESLLSHNHDNSLFEKPAWEGVFEIPAFSAKPSAPLRGVLLGPYRIRRLIGAGGMGAVYLATDTRLDCVAHTEHRSAKSLRH